MNDKQIKRLNAKIALSTKSLFNPQDFNATYDSSWLKDKFDKLSIFISKNAFCEGNGTALKDEKLNKLRSNANIDRLKSSISTRYALVVKYANHRIFPTNETLLKSPEQHFFDRNQNAALDIVTPLAILHQSLDKKWYFALSPSSFGWIEADNIAFASQEEMMSYIQSSKFVITINPKNALWLDDAYDDFVRMGVRLPYVADDGTYAEVKVPKRDKNGLLKLNIERIKLSDVNLGHLKYTQRVIITQAFKFLNAPYGWGGMFGEQDCSKFLQEIYATVGITLPRNSKQQIKSGAQIDFNGTTKQRMALLTSQAVPASTLLHLPGHIMLYLGDYEGIGYTIHTLWGASQGKCPIAKTVVTSIDFKNYIDQIDSITTLQE
jgi:hypothetical protein